jgi:hypothetical protein
VLAEEAVPLALFSFLRGAPDLEAVVKNTILRRYGYDGHDERCALRSS